MLQKNDRKLWQLLRRLADQRVPGIVLGPLYSLERCWVNQEGCLPGRVFALYGSFKKEWPMHPWWVLPQTLCYFLLLSSGSLQLWLVHMAWTRGWSQRQVSSSNGLLPPAMHQFPEVSPFKIVPQAETKDSKPKPGVTFWIQTTVATMLLPPQAQCFGGSLYDTETWDRMCPEKLWLVKSTWAVSFNWQFMEVRNSKNYCELCWHTDSCMHCTCRLFDTVEANFYLLIF